MEGHKDELRGGGNVPWALVPTDVARRICETCGAGVLRTYIALRSFDNPAQPGCCWPSQEAVAERAGLAVRTVRLHLAKLERGGYIRRERRCLPEGRGRASDVYTFEGNDDQPVNRLPVGEYDQPANMLPVKQGDQPASTLPVSHDQAADCLPVGHSDQPANLCTTNRQTVCRLPYKVEHTSNIPVQQQQVHCTREPPTKRQTGCQLVSDQQTTADQLEQSLSKAERRAEIEKLEQIAFKTYGTIPPALADWITGYDGAVEPYPLDHIRDAVLQTHAAGKRSPRWTQAVLEDWRLNGRPEPTHVRGRGAPPRSSNAPATPEQLLERLKRKGGDHARDS